MAPALSKRTLSLLDTTFTRTFALTYPILIPPIPNVSGPTLVAHAACTGMMSFLDDTYTTNWVNDIKNASIVENSKKFLQEFHSGSGGQSGDLTTECEYNVIGCDHSSNCMVPEIQRNHLSRVRYLQAQQLIMSTIRKPINTQDYDNSLFEDVIPMNSTTIFEQQQEALSRIGVGCITHSTSYRSASNHLKSILDWKPPPYSMFIHLSPLTSKHISTSVIPQLIRTAKDYARQHNIHTKLFARVHNESDAVGAAIGGADVLVLCPSIPPTHTSNRESKRDLLEALFHSTLFSLSLDTFSRIEPGIPRPMLLAGGDLSRGEDVRTRLPC